MPRNWSQTLLGRKQLVVPACCWSGQSFCLFITFRKKAVSFNNHKKKLQVSYLVNLFLMNIFLYIHLDIDFPG